MSCGAAERGEPCEFVEFESFINENLVKSVNPASSKQLARHCADTRQNLHFECGSSKACQRTDASGGISSQNSDGKVGAVVSKT